MIAHLGDHQVIIRMVIQVIIWVSRIVICVIWISIVHVGDQKDLEAIGSAE